METINDIVREMRKLGELDEKSTDRIPRSLMGLGLRTYADRIESAIKHEREATCEKSSQVGSAAAMRKALENSNGLIEELAPFGEWYESAWEQIKENNAALSAPPRNCDAFSKAEVLEVLEDRSFSKEDTIEWLFDEEKGEQK